MKNWFLEESGAEVPGRMRAGSPGWDLGRFARHVQAGIRFELRRSSESPAAPSLGAGEWVLYEDRKSSSAPPPPPRWPVYRLLCDAKGRRCRLYDLETGRTRVAENLFAGFVRMTRGGGIYVSPRPGLGLQGDSHPSIAARTPEGLAGQKALVAAGEVGILRGCVVGHNDKTGHFLSRRNREQSGLPSQLFYPYTVDPRRWYREP
jgi:hypothetical protein